MKTKAPQTRAEHQVNHLKKQLAGHQRLIADLQDALRIARSQTAAAEARAKGAEMAFDLACGVAQLVLKSECHDSLGVSCWMHRFPGILSPREDANEDSLEIHDPGGAGQVLTPDAAQAAPPVRADAGR